MSTDWSSPPRREQRRQRKRRRKKQQKINSRLKKKLFGHLAISPCCYCRQVFICQNLTIEHIIPLCLGGTNDPNNIALACAPCNLREGKKAWFQKQHSPEFLAAKQEKARRHYEQYSPEHRKQNGERLIQTAQPSTEHHQRESI